MDQTDFEQIGSWYQALRIGEGIGHFYLERGESSGEQGLVSEDGLGGGHL